MKSTAKSRNESIRQAILEAPGGITVAEVATLTGLTESAILPHLGAMLEAHQVRRQQLPRSTRGLWFPIAA